MTVIWGCYTWWYKRSLKNLSICFHYREIQKRQVWRFLADRLLGRDLLYSFFFFPLQEYSWAPFLDIWLEWKYLYSQWNLALTLPDFLPLPVFCSEQFSGSDLILLASFISRVKGCDSWLILSRFPSPEHHPPSFWNRAWYRHSAAHIVTLFKKIILLSVSRGMKGSVHFSGAFLWTGCIL